MLPQLREELILYSGPTNSDGAPTWSIHDPVRNLFFRVDWLTYEILSRWMLNSFQAILDALKNETTIHPEPEDITAVINFLQENELLQHFDQRGSSWYWHIYHARTLKWWQWLFHHYLFIRIPLWRPDSWLRRYSPRMEIFYTKTFLLITGVVLFWGLISVSRQWRQFTTTLIDFLSWSGAIQYLITLIGVKFLHELGHAFTAQRYGCRVPTMGIAFLVLFPLAYTDVNEAWKLRERYQRLSVSAAGIMVELIFAAWATFFWTILPDGFLRNSAFILATTTWISTLLINASPFMRFDGYFLLMDWLDMPNLHERAFALASWQLRELFFGIGEDPPEYFSSTRRFAIILFAISVWLYRLIIFTSIAILVYFWFPKPLGPFLAALELGWFILLPIFSELKNWSMRTGAILRSRRTWLTLSIFGLIGALIIFPWDRRISTQGLLRPKNHALIVAPGAAQIKSLLVPDGARVTAEQKLLILENSALIFQEKIARAQTVNLNWQVAAAAVDEKLRERRKVLQEQVQKADGELIAIKQEQARYMPLAPFAGQFFWAQPDFQIADWIGKNELLGVVANPSQWIVETYLPEKDLTRIQIGDLASFYSEATANVIIPLTVTRIDHDAIHDLPDGILSATRGGGLLARESGDQIIPEMALYRVILQPHDKYNPSTAQILRGSLILFGTPRAIIEDFFQAAVSIFIREASF